MGVLRDLLVEVKPSGGRRDADMPVFRCDDVQVHEVSVHFAVAWWRVPATHGQNF